jgi:uncharacterized protein YraI
MAMKKLLLTSAAVLFLATGTAHSTEDFCIEVTKTHDGFLALRKGPGTQFKMIAKLKPGFPLDADTRGFGKWTHVSVAVGHDGWVYTKYTRTRQCPEGDEACKTACNQ